MAIKLKKKTTKAKKIKQPRKPKKKRKARAQAKKQSQSIIEINSNKNHDLNYPTGKYIEAIGRRKVAVARVRIYEKSGDFIVNDKLVGKYFKSVLNAPVKFNLPFLLTNTKDKFSVTVQVKGSGISAQLDAVVHGLARALVKYEPKYKSILKEHDLMTRDDRMKESRKPGRGGKARRKRQSPKR